MAEAEVTAHSKGRPNALHSSRSFSRMDPPPVPQPPRKRASTFQEHARPSGPAARPIETSPELAGKTHIADVFENREDDDEGVQSGTGTPGPEIQLPSTFDELPIEIRSLTERFLESLSARVPSNTVICGRSFRSLSRLLRARCCIHCDSHRLFVVSDSTREVTSSFGELEKLRERTTESWLGSEEVGELAEQ